MSLIINDNAIRYKYAYDANEVIGGVTEVLAYVIVVILET